MKRERARTLVDLLENIWGDKKEMTLESHCKMELLVIRKLCAMEKELCLNIYRSANIFSYR